MERGVQGAGLVGELGTPGLGCLADEVISSPSHSPADERPGRLRCLWSGKGLAGQGWCYRWGMCLFGLTFSSPGKEVQRLGPGHLDGKAGLEADGPMEERREAGEGT